MKLILKTIVAVLGFLALIYLLKNVVLVESDHVKRTGVKVYVTSPTGESMDVSQAEASGLSPSKIKFAGVANIPVSALNTTPVANSTVPGETSVLGIAEGEDALAIDAGTLKERFVLNASLGAKKIVAVYDPATDSYYAYANDIKGNTFTIGLTGWMYKGEHLFEDEEGGSLWYRARGGLVVMQGEHLASRLYEIDSDISTLDKWSAEHPDSLLVK